MHYHVVDFGNLAEKGDEPIQKEASAKQKHTYTTSS